MYYMTSSVRPIQYIHVVTFLMKTG